MLSGVAKTAAEALRCKQGESNSVQHIDSKVIQSPLLTRLYHYRTVILHKMISVIFEKYIFAVPPTILILGAGLDQSYECYPTDIYLVDLPEVINQRVALSTTSSLPKIHFISVDLNDITLFISKLEESKFNFLRPTIVLLECVLPYLNETIAEQLLTTLSHRLSDSIMLMYDPLLTNQSHEENNNRNIPSIYGFSTMMRDKFISRQAPLLCCCSSIHEKMKTFLSSRWYHSITLSVQDTKEIFLTQSEKKYPFNDLFDEFASLALLLNHYSFTISSLCPETFQKFFHSLTGWVDHTDNISLYTQQQLFSIRSKIIHDRLFIANLRLKAIENDNHVTNRIIVKIRDYFPDKDHNDSLIELYTQAFHEMSLKYVSVRKYVKYSIKSLKDIPRLFKIMDESRFIVAVKNHNNDSHNNNEDICTIYGMLGIRVKKNFQKDSQVNDIKSAVLSHFCSDPAYRRCGIGKQLIEKDSILQSSSTMRVGFVHLPTTTHNNNQSVKNKKAINYLHSINCCWIELTILQDLIEARSLYQSFGFQCIGSENIGNNCYIDHMRLDLFPSISSH
eukprot:gene5689-7853_t